MSDITAPSASKLKPVEWPLLLALTLPLLLLAGLASAWQAGQAATTRLEAQAADLTAQVRSRFSNARSWRDEDRFVQALAPLNWRQAYLQDAQGARIWQQDRHQPAPAWPRPPALHVALDESTQLVLHPAGLPDTERRAVYRQVLATALLLHLLALALCLPAYLLARRPLLRILDWSARLERGQLTAAAPLHRGLSGAVAASMGVLAQRLRFSRDALEQHSAHADRRRASQVTESQREIQRLRAEIERTRENLASHSALTSGISHELRTPLTSILGFSELLEKGELSSEQREYLQTIRKSAKGLVSMINDMLDLERMDAGRLELHELAFDLNDVVEDTLSLLAPLAYEKQLELIRIVDHDVPAKLLGDAGRIQQILTNLVSNAIKFTEQGEVLVHVSRQADAGEQVWIQLQVEDTGIGLTSTQRTQLFTAYQRFAEDDTRRGSGLGLTIVKRLTELLQGRIEVDSEPGGGSRFCVSVPLQPHPEPAHRAAWDALRERRIWVLEAQDNSWRALHHLLAFWQVESRRFASAAELYRTLESLSVDRHPDLLLLGLPADEAGELPVRDVLQLAADCHIPAGCLVSSIDSGVHRALRDLGAQKVAPKCCDRSSLYRHCCELLSDGGTWPQRALQGTSVLVAENNAASRHYLRALLDSLGAEVQLVEDGDDALREAERALPRFLLLDQNMPRMSGIEATRAIRALPESEQTAIIGMPAFLSRDEERHWRDAGLDALLPKPFDESQLLRCLHPWLRGRPRVEAGPDKPQLAQQLLDDPELSGMIIDELPRQLQELDDAYIAAALRPCRDAAHQLHGTAAFYHLEPLKSHVQRLEKRLQDIDDITRYPWLRDDMADVAQAVHDVTETLRRRRGASAA